MPKTSYRIVRNFGRGPLIEDFWCIFAETFSVGRGVIDISVTSDAAKEIINAGNEIIRSF